MGFGLMTPCTTNVDIFSEFSLLTNFVSCQSCAFPFSLLWDFLVNSLILLIPKWFSEWVISIILKRSDSVVCLIT